MSRNLGPETSGQPANPMGTPPGPERSKSRKSRRKSRKTTKRRRKSRQRGGSTLGYSMPGVGGSHGQLAPYSIGGRYFGNAGSYTHGK